MGRAHQAGVRPGLPAPSREAKRAEALTFAAILAMVAAVLVRANLG